MKVWITKYALTKGIIEAEAEVCIDADKTGNMIECRSAGREYCIHGEGRNWHKSKEGAVKKAEAMRKKKIETLKKEIEKLENLTFN